MQNCRRNVVSIAVDEENEELLIKKLKQQKWVKEIKRHDGMLGLTMDHGAERIPEIIELAQKEKVKIKSVDLHKPSLEDVFIHFTGKTIRETEASQKDKFRLRTGMGPH